MVTTFATLADKVATDVWGFVPNRQIKPVHFANGLARALFGQAGAPKLLQAAGAGIRSGRSRVSTAQLLVDIRDAYDSDDPARDVEAAQALRTALDLVLHQDRAFFANGFASPTLSHWLHSTSDPSDRGSGQFMAELLTTEGADGAVAALRAALDRPDDNTYFLTAPLLPERTPGPPPTASEEIKRLADTHVLRQLKAAFATLAKHHERLEKATFVQRAVTLACFGLFLDLFDHLPMGSASPLLPLLLCAPAPHEDVREASRATFGRARQSIEQVFEAALGHELEASRQAEMTADEYRDLARTWLPNLEGQGRGRQRDARVWQRFEQDFSAFLVGAARPFDAFRAAATRAAFLGMAVSGGDDPEDFAAGIGRMIGLVFPRVAGRGDKYFRPAPEFLDALVVSLLAPGEDVTMDEFWRRAGERFGVVSGALGTRDQRLLAAWGVRQATPTNLEANARGLLAELIRMGHAREYADDVAMIRAGGGLEA